MDRRLFLAGGLALAAAPTALSAGTPATRTFRILRDGSDIGRHTLSARLGSEGFEIDVEAEIIVRFAGIPVYRYELTNREIWQGRRLMRLDSRVNDDGDPFELKIRPSAEGLEIDGTGYAGVVPLDAATTSYFTPDFAARRPWISTQSGKPLAIETRRDATGGGSQVVVSGELDLTISYDGRGEWIGSAFLAGGEPASYEMIEETGAIAALWSQA